MYLIAIDSDGTLRDNNGIISNNTKKILNKIEKVLIKNIPDNPINKVIVEEMLDVLKEFNKIKDR